MDNSNAPIQFNVLNKQLIGNLWNMWDGLYFNYIKVPQMFCRVNGWLSIIHRSGSWKMFEFRIHKISKMFAMWMVELFTEVEVGICALMILHTQVTIQACVKMWTKS